MDTAKRCFVIPPGEKRCVWMDAGILPYQLCVSAAGCDDCTVDAAMRWHSESPVAAAGEVRMPPSASLHRTLQEGVRYSRNHLWVRKTAHGRLRTGMEPGLIEALLNVKGIVFPSVRQQLCKGQPCAWAVMDSGTLPLESPVAGGLALVNQDLVAKPHLLTLRPFHDGWLAEIEVEDADAELAALMAIGEAGAKFAIDQQRFKSALGETARGRRASMTGADSPARYFAIIRQCFGWSPYR